MPASADVGRRATHLLPTQTKERLDRIEVELEPGADHGLVEVGVDEPIAALVGAVRVEDPTLLEHQTLAMSETTESVLPIDGRHEQPSRSKSGPPRASVSAGAFEPVDRARQRLFGSHARYQLIGQ